MEQLKIVGTLTLDEVKQIMELREQGLNSKQISDKIGRTLVIVNMAISENSGIKVSDEEKKDDDDSDSYQILPAKAGYLRKLVEQKTIENQSLKETRDFLVYQLKSLRKIIPVLELRKQQLEDYIIQMEKYIKIGSDTIDFMEIPIKED